MGEKTYVHWEEEDECFAILNDITHIDMSEWEDGTLRMGFYDDNIDSSVTAIIDSYDEAVRLGYLLADYAPSGFSDSIRYADVLLSSDFEIDPDELCELTADIIVGRSDDDIRNFAEYLYEGYFARL